MMNFSKMTKKSVLFAVAAATLAFTGSATDAKPVKPHKLLLIPKFVDDLPTLSRIKVPSNPGQFSELTIELTATTANMHSALQPTPVFAYNGSTPGPVIDVESGQALRVHWKNSLPLEHVFKAPLGGMDMHLPEVKAVTHLHGALVSQSSTKDKLHDNDGWPDLFTVPGEEQIAEYPNRQSARLLWFHDHAMSDTGRNVAAGLVGVYIVRDEYERSLNLPSGDYEIPLVFQQQGFLADGNRYYTDDLAAEFYGNSATINGKLWPKLKVEPRKYRFRIVNAANARSFALRIHEYGNEDAIGPAMYQIGSDAGFLQDTVVLNEPGLKDPPRLVLAPAERADIVVDFSNYAGKTLLLQNNSLDPGDGAEIPLPQMMQIQVSEALKSPDSAQIPMHMREIVRTPESQSVQTRRIVIDSMDMPDGRPMLMLNGMSWHDPVTEKPVVNSTEIWEIVNLQPDIHPFHVHLVQFQVLDRIPFDVEAFQKTGEYKFTGPPELPEANEMGWKDVVRANPKYITRIIMKFEQYTGHYVYHCHILEHEDMDMMRPFEVVAEPKPVSTSRH
jgi:spore coat protein A